jgi:hypothetical protein
VHAARRLAERLAELAVRGQLERRRHALQAGLGEQGIGPRPAAGADRVLEQAVGEDHIGSGKILSLALGSDHVGAVVGDELQVEGADRGAGGAAAGRFALHVQQAVGESEVAALDQLDEPLTLLERGLVRVAEDSVALELQEAHQWRQPFLDQSHQLTDDRVRVLELGAGEKSRIARDVGQQQVAPSGLLIRGHGATIPPARRAPRSNIVGARAMEIGDLAGWVRGLDEPSVAPTPH